MSKLLCVLAGPGNGGNCLFFFLQSRTVCSFSLPLYSLSALLFPDFSLQSQQLRAIGHTHTHKHTKNGVQCSYVSAVRNHDSTQSFTLATVTSCSGMIMTYLVYKSHTLEWSRRLEAVTAIYTPASKVCMCVHYIIVPFSPEFVSIL